MQKQIKKLNKKLHNQLLLVILLLLLLPLTLFQVLQQQTLRQEAAKKNKQDNNKDKKNKSNKNTNNNSDGNNKPNIILILSDDQPDDTLKYIPLIRDRLGNQGMTFTNAFVTTGLCCPSRTSVLTGQYTHNHGVWKNRPPLGGAQQFKGHDKETLPVWLKQAGYKTGLFGKYLNEYDKIAPYIPPGWDQWVAFDDDNGKYFDYKLTINRKSKTFGDKPDDYSTDVLANEAVDFIKKTKQPFFLYFAPHTPHGVPRPAPRHENKCGNANFDRNPSFNENDVSDKPSWVKKLPKLRNKDINEQREEFRLKMCTLKALDDAVNDMLKALGNRRDNTIIIFMSDNGYSFGDHRWTKKECSYDVCVAVDMIISYPKLTPNKKTSSEFALNIDLAPTILDLAGLAIPSSVNGKSLKPLLENPNTVIHDSFLIETYNNETKPKGEDYAIRSKEYMYNEMFNGERELYDLKKDPYELVNVAGSASYKNIIQQLSADIAAMKKNQPPPSQPSPTASPSASLTSSPSVSLSPTTTPTPSGKVTPTGAISRAPTPTISGIPPDSTGGIELAVSLLLDGIGSGGDLVNEQDNSLSNKDPYTLERDIILEFWDGNIPIGQVKGTLTYDEATGKYTGSVFVNKSVAGKAFTIKVQGINYLVKKFPEPITIPKDGKVTLPDLHLVTGDVNGDNELSLLDYNLMLYCYGEDDIPDACFDDFGVVGDLNDDAYVLEVDYNLFIRELSKIQKGD